MSNYQHIITAQRGIVADETRKAKAIIEAAEKRSLPGLTATEQRQVEAILAKRDAAKRELDAATDALAREDAFAASEVRDGHAGATITFAGGMELAGSGTAAAPTYSQLLRSGNTPGPRFSITEPATYRRDNAHDVSFFRDLYASRRGDYAAAERLHRNAQERATETRTGDLASSSATTGGSFAPPLWLVEDYVALARASRVTANVLTHQPLPAGVSSINIPKVATGTATGAQNGQNTTLADTAATTSALTASIHTVAGKQIVSLQMIDQSGIPFDQVVLGDLAADAARTLDQLVISGTGTNGQPVGLLSGGTAVTYTSTAPVVAGTSAADSFMAALTRGINSVHTTRYMPPDAIVMHPRRWAWVLEAVDTQGRPLVTPDAAGGSFNSFGSMAPVAAEGKVGTLLGLPVYVDPNIPTNLGAGTNQDQVLVMRSSDLWLYESEPRLEAFEATYADQASVLFRAVGYVADPLIRYAGSLSVIGGTGLVAPTL